jgi:signal transduction histidine kinase
VKARPTARARLALLHTGLVVAAGLVLIGLTYLLVRHSLARGPLLLVSNGPSGEASPAPIDTQAAQALLDQAHHDTLSQLLTQSAIALGAVVGLAAVVGWLVAGRVLRPVRTIAATARRLATTDLSTEDLSERKAVTTPADELAELADTINDMLDRIQTGLADRDRLLAGQRMFVANAAHELRTPLATMRTAIDVTLDGDPDTAELHAMAADISFAVERSRRTLDGLLALAHSQTGPIRRDLVDLSSIGSTILDEAQAAATARGVRLYRDLPYAPIHGDAVLLERMVANLVDNAIRYNRPSGEVSVATGTTGRYTRLRVANTGEQLTTENAERLWRPFIRGDHSHDESGAGLGLSIVRAVAHAHGGDIHAVPQAHGGLVVTITFPAATSPMWTAAVSTKPSHPALVSDHDFITAEAVTGRARPADGATHTYLLVGLLRCGDCGRSMDSQWSHGNPCYRCRHGHTTAHLPGARSARNLHIREDVTLARLRAELGHLAGRDPRVQQELMKIRQRNTPADLIAFLHHYEITITCHRTHITLQADSADLAFGPDSPDSTTRSPRAPRQRTSRTKTC